MLNLPKPPQVNLQKEKQPHERLFVDSICKTLEEKGVLYQREVPTPVGYIDVLTDDTLYEAKHWSGVKHALGQILFYGYYYPRPSYVIVLFAKNNSKDKIDHNYVGLCMSVLDGLGLQVQIKTKEDFML
ncbi:MAG: hypothetical protein IM613_12785 [Cytophagales bacterium]|nr:hypothetical protein [Cytophagales bacterium]